MKKPMPNYQKVAELALAQVAEGNRCPKKELLLKGIKTKNSYAVIRQARRYLVLHMNSCVICVSQNYYRLNPDRKEKAAKCLPGGQGLRLAGFLFPLKGDLVFKVYAERYLKNAAKGLGWQHKIMDIAIEHGVISESVREIADQSIASCVPFAVDRIVGSMLSVATAEAQRRLLENQND